MWGALLLAIPSTSMQAVNVNQVVSVLMMDVQAISGHLCCADYMIAVGLADRTVLSLCSTCIWCNSPRPIIMSFPATFTHVLLLVS